MNDDARLIWESYNFENQLNMLRASLNKGDKGIILTDLFRDDPEQATDDSVPVKVTYMELQTPVVQKLESGEIVPNFVGHWSLEPGQGVERTAVGKSIQHAMKYDSPVSSAADHVGDKTKVYGTMQTVITNVERDEKFGDELEQLQRSKQHVAKDMAKWKYD